MGRVFSVGRSLLSSEYQPTNNLEKFLENASGVGVDLGSGGRRLRPDIITVDLFPSINVDIVADIAETPFRDAVADYIILDSVIEHVPDPVAVVAEAHRILRAGGRIFINCPFMLPYHGYPAHYQNFTRDGLRHLLRTFENVDVRPTFGPMTAWVNMTAETFAVLLAGERGTAYLVAKAVALLPIFWLKYLDRFFVKSSQSHRVSGLLCATATR
jgi:SAM-dependent methyltransferase